MTMPNDHEHAGCGEVTQEDREAAAEIVVITEYAELIIAGRCDDATAVQAFTRHRLASYEAGRAEGVREAAEVADKVRGGWVNGDATTPYGQAYQAGATDAATAIRALSKEPTK